MWSKELDSEFLEVADLPGTQFRCAGSAEYVDWVDALLANAPMDSLIAKARRWYPRPNVLADPDGGMPPIESPVRGLDFRIFDDPLQWRTP